MKKILPLTLCLFLFTAINVSAFESLFEDRFKTETGTFEDDYLFCGEELEFPGEAEDLFFFGRMLHFTGKAKLGFFAFGREIYIDGDVGNGINACGDTIKITGNVKGTNLLCGPVIIIENEAVINGPIFILGGNVHTRGRINGNIYILAGNVNIGSRIDGNVSVFAGNLLIGNEVKGNVKARVGRISISGQGRIDGNLIYSAHKKLSEQDLVKIKGEVRFEEEKEKSKPSHFVFLIKLFLRLSFIVSGLLLLFIPATKRLEDEGSPRIFWLNSLWGLIPFFMYPSAIVLSVLLVITIPLAGMLLLALIPILFVTNVLGVAMLGQFIFRLIKWKITKRHLFFLMGSLICIALGFIPYISIILMIFLSSLGWSYVLLPLFQEKLNV